jgi:hypothetical protein
MTPPVPSGVQLDETILPDDYPIFPHLLYVIDGAVKPAGLFGSVADLKASGVKQVRRCEIVGRQLMDKPGNTVELGGPDGEAA